MKKIVAILLLVVLAILNFVSTTWAVGDFVIEDFSSFVTIQADGYVKVKETMVVNFPNPLHGIYRDIPVNYQRSDGTKLYTTLDIKSIKVNAAPANYEIIRNTNNLRLKIGDANKLISGQQIYEIEYLAGGVVSSLADYDELYWNVTGNYWEVPINHVSAIFNLPSGDILQTACYQGMYGSTEKCLTSFSGPQANFETSRNLNINEGMTMAAGLPKGLVPIINVPAPVSNSLAFSFGYLLLGFVIAFVLSIIIFIWQWWLKGRDNYYKRKSLHDPLAEEKILPFFGYHESIVPEYDPPLKLKPAEIGVLLDEEADPHDISATIVDLAVKGYLTITEIKKEKLFNLIPLDGSLNKFDYLLTKTDKPRVGLLSYEILTLDRIFVSKSEVKISSLRNGDFTQDFRTIQASLYADIADKKLFHGNPEKVRNKYRIIGGVMFGLGFIFTFGYFFLSSLINNDLQLNIVMFFVGVFASLIMSGFLLVLWLANLMPKRTAYGREIYRQALGYKLFVSGTEKYRQPFFEKQNIFMEVLPYAMVFGVTDKLVKAMAEMGLSPATPWYIGSNALVISSLSSSLNDFSNSFSAVAAPAPSGSGSGGGGFSGGGGGGGGGGGW